VSVQHRVLDISSGSDCHLADSSVVVEMDDVDHSRGQSVFFDMDEKLSHSTDSATGEGQSASTTSPGGTGFLQLREAVRAVWLTTPSPANPHLPQQQQTVLRGLRVRCGVHAGLLDASDIL
jgi:hypothetical protein